MILVYKVNIMKLLNINKDTYYFDNPSIIGLYRINDKDVILIDTGLDDSATRKVLRIINENNWNLIAVINTHSHADHCGGNKFIQKKTKAEFYAPKIEKSYIESPIIEPHFLYGAYPPKDLMVKFLQAEESKIDHILEEGKLVIKDKVFDIINLKGHSPNQMGIITPDNVFFVADSIIDSDIIKKYKLLYNYSVEELLSSLDILKNIEAGYYVLSHGGVKRDISSDIKENQNAIDKVNMTIESILETGMIKNDIHKFISKKFGIDENIPNYYLNDSLLSSHLSYLVNNNKITFELINGEIIYKNIKNVG